MDFYIFCIYHTLPSTFFGFLLFASHISVRSRPAWVAFRNLSDTSSPTATSAANPAFVYHYLSQNKPVICVTDDAHTQINAWFALFSLFCVFQHNP